MPSNDQAAALTRVQRWLECKKPNRWLDFPEKAIRIRHLLLPLWSTALQLALSHRNALHLLPTSQLTLLDFSLRKLNLSSNTLGIGLTMSDAQAKSLSDLPVELLLDHLLPTLDVKDLLALGTTNRNFAELCNDETFWKLKCKQDFNFSGSRTARTQGWRFIYKGLTDPKVFVWG